jgi:hypothetical protein
MKEFVLPTEPMMERGFFGIIPRKTLAIQALI